MKTKLDHYASRILLGTSLEDKLFNPGVLDLETRFSPHAVPDRPGRPESLPMVRERGGNPSSRLPSIEHLRDPSTRAGLLSRFVHHEIQALELMALMLLRFPDVDVSYRRTLVSTMKDEQRHLRMYLERISELGGHDIEPGSRFFWDILAHSHTPSQFIAGMSLTLEQANLDFLTHWGAALRSVGDLETVDVLAAVYRDEVRHVRHGAQWLSAWKEPDEDLWTAWTKTLRPPLTPRRARGISFDRAGRERAGLPAEWIDRVRIAAGSRGRTPRLYSFNPWVESLHAYPGFTPPTILRQVAADLAPTLAAVAGDDDAIHLYRGERPAFLASLADRGWPLPERVVSDDPITAAHRFREHQTWGRSDEDTRTLSRKDLVPSLLARLPSAPSLDTEPGCLVRSMDELRLARSKWERTVVKLPWSAAGRGLRFDDGDYAKWLDQCGVLLIEPWRERIIDLSLNATMTDQGLKRTRVSRFLTTDRGGFRGTVCGPWRHDLPSEVQRFLVQDGKDKNFLHRSLEGAMRTTLSQFPNYRGPIGIDAMVVRVAGQLKLRPIVEVNPRMTFGKIGYQVGKLLLHPDTIGIWFHLTRRDLGTATTFQELADRLRDLAPSEGTPLHRGAVWTTDPEATTHIGTVMIAGPSTRSILDTLQLAQRA